MVQPPCSTSLLLVQPRPRFAHLWYHTCAQRHVYPLHIKRAAHITLTQTAPSRDWWTQTTAPGRSYPRDQHDLQHNLTTTTWRAPSEKCGESCSVLCTDAVDVVLRLVRQRHVHNKRQALDVQTARSQISADQEPYITLVKRLTGARPEHASGAHN